MKGISLVAATLIAVLLLGVFYPAPLFAQSADAQSADPKAPSSEGATLLKAPAKKPLFPDEQHAPGTNTGIKPGAMGFTPDETRALQERNRSAPMRLPTLEAFTGGDGGALEFRPLELIAPGSRLSLVTNGTASEFTMPERRYFLATNRSTSIGLAVNSADGEVRGFGVKDGQRVEISGFTDVGLEFIVTESHPAENNSCATTQDDQPAQALAFIEDEPLLSLSEAPAGDAISYQALMAIDTDTEWMAGKGNSTTTAMNFITEIFLAMNVFYERDIETRLVVGDVTLRVGSDPYSEPSNRSDQLDEFAEYWRVNRASVDRDFATMFSGRAVSSGQFSGIAWINQYCKKGTVQGGRTVGSYNFNAIGSGRTPANTAIFVGHEIGHNLGSPHTHCYSPAVDQCYNLESGCYSGSVSCPAGGKGTVMSYCHVSGSGAAACGSSKQEFHPTVQALLENRLASNSPSCVAAYVDPPQDTVIFDSSFEP